MDAKQARELSDKVLGEVVITPWLERIDTKIKEACNKGYRSILDPDLHYEGTKFNGSLSGAEYKKVKAHYISLGYNWIEHENPDPGHPCSREYVELKW